MDHALAEARIEHVVGHLAPPVGDRGGHIAAMQEHQVQVRAVTQLDTAELAVADDREAGIEPLRGSSFMLPTAATPDVAIVSSTRIRSRTMETK